MNVADAVVLHGFYNLQLIILRRLIDRREALRKQPFYLLSELQNLSFDSQLLIHRIHFHDFLSPIHTFL